MSGNSATPNRAKILFGKKGALFYYFSYGFEVPGERPIQARFFFFGKHIRHKWIMMKFEENMINRNQY